MDESPNTVHGRLLEAVHLSGYSFERACAELEWLLDEDRWKSIGPGFEDIRAFIDTLKFSSLKGAVEQRKKLAKRLADLDASQRSIGRLLGVNASTVNRDLTVANATEHDPTQGPSDRRDVANATPWFQTDTDPAADAKRIARRAAKPGIRAAKLEAAIWPEGKHGVILADPPWKPDEGLLDPTRQIENQYPTQTLAELIAHKPQIDALAADDCVLLLWATTQKLGEAIALIDAWGFIVKSGAVWIKPSIGMGYWFRARHELIVLATRGEPLTPLEADRPDSVIEADRRGHSEKPDTVYALIERMFPLVPKVEIFSRTWRQGWSTATNESTLRVTHAS